MDRQTKNVLTVDFNPNRGPPYRPTIEIGKINNKKFIGSLGHAVVNKSKGRWNVENVTFIVNEKKINHTQQMNFGLSPYICVDHLLIVFCRDTGGAGSIQVELPVAQTYYKEVDGKEVSLAGRDPATASLM